RTTPSVVFSPEYRVRDDVLGFAPAKGIRTRATRSFRGRQTYDVTYTIDSRGLRAAPAEGRSPPPDTVLFFGCSFTFAEGLHDDETMASQVAIRSGGRVRTFNFGFPGYGPHQMLAAIEHGVVRRVVESPPRYAIYLAHADHVRRVAGLVSWGAHSPRYRL